MFTTIFRFDLNSFGVQGVQCMRTYTFFLVGGSVVSLKSFRLSNVCPDCFPAEFEVMFVVILNCPADTCITNKEITGKCRVVELYFIDTAGQSPPDLDSNGPAPRSLLGL